MFSAAVDAKLYVLAVVGVLTSAVGCYYYLRIVKIMYFDEPAAPFVPARFEIKAVIVLAALFVTLFVALSGAAGGRRRRRRAFVVLKPGGEAFRRRG